MLNAYDITPQTHTKRPKYMPYPVEMLSTERHYKIFYKYFNTFFVPSCFMHFILFLFYNM